MARLKFALLVLGAVLGYFGIQELRLATAARQQPQKLTLAELEKNGPGDNANVVLSEYEVCTMAFVYESGRGGSGWSRVYVPLVSHASPWLLRAVEAVRRNQPVPAPDDLRVIVRTTQVHSDQDMKRMAEQPTLRGLIVNKIESLGSKERQLLHQSYPGVNFDNVWIVDEGRKPASTGKVLGLLVGGVAAITLSLGLYIRGRRQPATPAPQTPATITQS